jgi:hypothetical protein
MCMFFFTILLLSLAHPKSKPNELASFVMLLGQDFQQTNKHTHTHISPNPNSLEIDHFWHPTSTK